MIKFLCIIDGFIDGEHVILAILRMRKVSTRHKGTGRKEPY